MATLGAPVTNGFYIGAAELRIGPLSAAQKLTQAHSVGNVEDITYTASQTSVTKMGGYPKKLVATSISTQESKLSAKLGELSWRNINILLGKGVPASVPSDVSTTAAATAAVAATTLSVTSAAGITAGKHVVVYPAGFPDKVQVLLVASIATNVLTLSTETPVLISIASGDNVFVANQIALGDIDQTNYFSVSVIQKDPSNGRPTGFSFWKASVSSGMEYAFSTDNFATPSIELSILEPSGVDYATGGPLNHIASIIPTNPVGMRFGGT